MIINGAAAKEFCKTIDDLEKLLTLGLMTKSEAKTRATLHEVEIPGFVRREFHV
ncbi:MAG: hypothetical protein LKE33_08105 [Acidaminococcus sp.]|jgi:hypothetical protein|nr:hypothetical protein [Acidaminococcus sp.]